MIQPLIKVKDVYLAFKVRRGFFRYRYKPVFSNLSFDVRVGESLGIVGRNGCGKSTLLRLLAGIFIADSGTIERGSSTVSLLTMAAGFDEELSGRDNILLSAMLLGSSRAEAEQNMASIIEFCELGSAIDEPIRVYSTGMRMRLGFSIAVTMKPDVLLIDEALSSGDAAFQPKAQAAITGKIRSDQTVVLVSHNRTQINELCDRAIWLEDGTVAMSGDPQKITAAFEHHLQRNRKSGRDAGVFMHTANSR